MNINNIKDSRELLLLILNKTDKEVSDIQKQEVNAMAKLKEQLSLLKGES